MRYAFLSLALVASLLTVAIGGQGVSAVTPSELSHCQDPAQSSNNLEQINNLRAVYALGPLDPATTPFIQFKYANGNEYYYVTENPEDLVFFKEGVDDYEFKTNDTGWRNVYNPTAQTNNPSADNRNPWNNSIVCVYDSANLNYDSTWDIDPVYSSQTSPPPPTDICSNIDGTQETMPSGKEDPDNDGVCTDIIVTPPPDPDPPPTENGDISFTQKISAVFSFGILALIAKQFVFRIYD